MLTTIKTLLEQMRITDAEIRQRKDLLFFTSHDAEVLTKFAPIIAENIDTLVEEFYRIQLGIPEIALLIGDADTLTRLQRAQHKYIVDLFSGVYDLEYVNNRLRVGLVHKRIGVEPKLYLSATKLLKELLFDLIGKHNSVPETTQSICSALDKLLYFDVTLIVETYIRSLLTEIEIAKGKSEQYARNLEERTRQFEELARVDPLTGLLNRRSLPDILSRELVAAQRRLEMISLVYIDIDYFKQINDESGHKRGDEVLQVFAEVIRATARATDICFRMGGDEFCILMPNCNARNAETIFCTRFREHLNERLPSVGASIGVHSTGPDSYVTAATLIEHADEAMLAVKRTRNEPNGKAQRMQDSAEIA
ncbi:GGDEF domain-containing protein [Edaphobacter flagellatus]|uniref:GGDEF domain-containing protein n=1 Tax=Edaphobacter flagellatus TaxID=1933044 RepID=UPI0021B1A0A0|nr:GGDEF domain-containing protein [Edaphobacter flagellatus]